MLITNYRNIVQSSILVFLTFLLIGSYAERNNFIKDAKLQNTPKFTKIKLKFTKRPKYKSFILENPYRIVLEFYNTRTKYNFKKLLINNTYLTKIRVHQNTNKLRLVFNTIKNTIYRHKFVKNNNSLDLMFYSDQLATKKHTKKSYRTKKQPLRNIKILIDPGHGGNDPGAVGKYGACEKDITLKVSLQLKKIIDKEPGLTATLTRNSDQYLHIRTRLQHARKKSSDLFLSIHADGFSDQSCKGASVYILSRHGATTEAARWIAARENYSVLGGDIDLKEKDSFLRTMLYDLSQTATLAASTKMARSILRELSKVTSLHSRRIEKGPFAVLKSPDIPSVLVELGFLSNIQEEKKLNRIENRHLLARAIFTGVVKYLKVNPIKGTYSFKSLDYIVKKGDNLGKIAKRYSTTTIDIKKMNKLRNTALVPGMKLKIPNIV